MAGQLADFFKSLMSNQSPGVPFSQLVSDSAPTPMPQQFAQTDSLSPLEQYLAKQRMLKMRGDASIQTIDPGRTWNGYGKNAEMPEDVMIDNFWSPYRQRNI